MRLARLLCLGLAGCICFLATGQGSPNDVNAPGPTWVRTTDYNYGPDEGKFVFVDTSGNIYQVSQVQDEAGEEFRVMIEKRAPSGARLWLRVYSTSSQWTPTYVNDAAIDIDGNLYFTGYTLLPGKKLILVKYSSSGTLAWEELYDRPGGQDDVGTSIELTTPAQIYVGAVTYASDTASDATLLKFDSAGTLIWSRFISTGASDENFGTVIHRDGPGSIYVTYARDNDATNGRQWGLARYDNTGNLKFSVTHGLASTINTPYAIEVRDTNRIYVSGEVESDSGGFLGAVMTYDSLGNRVDSFLTRKYTPPRTESIYGIESAGSSLYAFGGTRIGTNYRWTVRRFNLNLDTLWTKEFDRDAGSSIEVPYAMVIDSIHGVFVTGATYAGSTLFDLTTRKLRISNGQELWVDYYNGSANLDDKGYSLARHGSDLYVGGCSTMPPGFPNRYKDAALLKYSLAFDTIYSVTPTATTIDMKSIVRADIDADNRTDVIFAGSQAGDSLYIAYGTSGGSLQTPQPYYLQSSAGDVMVAYVDADTMLDVVMRSTTQIVVGLNQGSRNFVFSAYTMPERSPDATPAPAITYGYFDNNTSLDIVASPNRLYLNNGSGVYAGSNLPFSFRAVATADFDLDGRDDLVIYDSSSIVIMKNIGGASFSQAAAVAPLSIVSNTADLLAGSDFNQDGRSDFVILTATLDSITTNSFLRIGVANTGGLFNFPAPTTVITGFASNLTICDADRDTKLDIALVNARTGRCEIWYGNGMGGFDDSLSVVLSLSQDVITSGDIDRDGNPDFVTGGESAAIIITTANYPDQDILVDEMVVTSYDGVKFTVTNPAGFEISSLEETVAGSDYWRTDVDNNDSLDDRTFDYNLMEGEYAFLVYPGPGTSLTNPVTLDIRIDGSSQIKAYFDYTGGYAGRVPSGSQLVDSMYFYYTVEDTSSMQPPNGVKTGTQRPTFGWSRLFSGSAPTKYHFQLDKYFDFRSPTYNDSTFVVSNFTPPANLGADSIFYWRVRGYVGEQWTAWSRTMAAYIGTGCCIGYTGNVNKSVSETPDLSDLSLLIAYLIQSPRPTLPCTIEANINAAGVIDISDLSLIIAYLTTTPRPILPTCLQ